jgi:hypothetical protein
VKYLIELIYCIRLKNYFKIKKGTTLSSVGVLQHDIYVFNSSNHLWQNDPNNAMKESRAKQFVRSLFGYVSIVVKFAYIL